MSPFAAPFIISSISPHTHTLILLHDRGGSGQEFGLDLLGATDSSGRLLQTRFPGTKLIFPNANHQCVTSLGGPRMPQWFDNFSTKNPSEREALQCKGLRESSHLIHDLVNDESIPLENIFLGGFSQGSAMALYALLTYRPEAREGHLGGLVGMSGWLPLQKSLDGLIMSYDYAKQNNDNDFEKNFDVNVQVSTLLRNQIGLPPTHAPPPKYKNIPIHFCHGDADAEVTVSLAQEAANRLRKLGFSVILHTFNDLAHAWRSGDEVDDIAAFLSAQGVT